ncbi:hypothetical protein HanRHA438_Chr16g0748681 [Helianthus annuus]|nr:hypothetical protein HanRHA438_Chr16g0748681 [Helianthus annuus]
MADLYSPHVAECSSSFPAMHGGLQNVLYKGRTLQLAHFNFLNLDSYLSVPFSFCPC